jgi:two-component sensor histidine kinase
LQAQDEERRRIARELHDGAGQLIAALGMEASNLATERDRLSSRAASSLTNIESLVVQMTQDIRTMSHLLYPPLLDDIGLQSALTEYVKGFAERSGIQVSLDLPDAIKRLDRDYELSLFRIIQECLTNIHRHSGSKTASIRIVQDDGALVLEVRDEGRGMPAERLSEIQSIGSGVGIRGMRERVLQFCGRMGIESDVSGTRIHVVIPTPKTASRESTRSGVTPNNPYNRGHGTSVCPQGSRASFVTDHLRCSSSLQPSRRDLEPTQERAWRKLGRAGPHFRYPLQSGCLALFAFCVRKGGALAQLSSTGPRLQTKALAAPSSFRTVPLVPASHPPRHRIIEAKPA